jgi:SNF2 family DNA or RNA helicase
MEEKEAKIYKKMKQDLILPLDDDEEITAQSAAALSNKLIQMANGAVYTDEGGVRVIHDHKLEALADIIEQQNGKPLLVAYWYKHDLSRIEEYLTKVVGITPVRIDSEEAIRAWTSRKVTVGLIHPASAGHGLNLQSGGSALCWFGLTWSLELYQQTNARLYRQGQKETTVITHIITKGTMDQAVMSALENKDLTQNMLINSVRAELKK